MGNPEGKKVEETKLKIEDVFENIGGYGRFQKIFSLLILFPQFTVAMIILSPNFTGKSDVTIYCEDEDKFLRENDCLANCTRSMGDETLSSIVQEWGLVCTKNWIADAITSCQMAGTMAGALVSSIIADHYGRKISFYFIAFGIAFGGLLPALATSPWTYAVARFIAGFGTGGCFVTFLVHLMEFLTPSWRIICGCVSLWPLGEMLLGLAAYLIPNWRYLTIVSAAPTFLIFILYPFIQESPRWLLTQKRTNETQKILNKIARWNYREPPTVETVEALQAAVLEEEADVLKGFEGIKQIIRNSKLRRDLLILTWSSVTCAVVYYGVSFNAKSLSGDPYWNIFYMGILDLMGVPAILMFSNRLGRKKTFLIYMTLASAFLACIVVMEVIIGNAVDHPMLITAFALLGRFGIVASWGALTCNVMEAFPTTLRSTCMGFTAFAGYLGGVVAPQTVFLGNISRSIPYIMYLTCTVTSAFFSLFLQEMAGEPLEDTAK